VSWRVENIPQLAWDKHTEHDREVSVATEQLEEAVDVLMYVFVTDCNNVTKLLAPSLNITQKHINNPSTQMLATTPITRGKEVAK
jgi:hypothetical protein